MKRFLRSEIGTALIWVVATLLLAALISPWIYQAGKHLAARAAVEDLPAWLEWLGAACERSKFGRFFDRSLLLSALLLLPLLFRRIRQIRATGGAPAMSLAKVPASTAAAQIAIGWLIAGSLLWALGLGLDFAGAYELKPDSPALKRLLTKVLIPGVVASLLEEWLFRGVLLGLWLRVARPAVACLGTSLLFAVLHFLKPAPGTVIADPTHPLAGFELLGKIGLHFTDPVFFITDFATLLAIGLILAWARVRTGALWFSIGLHAGWIMAYMSFKLFYQNVPGHPLHPWGVGDNLKSGLLPLIALAVTAVVCHFVMRRFAPAHPTIPAT